MSVLLDVLSYDDLKTKFGVGATISTSIQIGVGAYTDPPTDTILQSLFDFQLPKAIVVQGTVVIKVDGAAVGNDSVAPGTIAGATASGTVEYGSGISSIQFSEGNEPTAGLVLTAEFNYINYRTRYEMVMEYFATLSLVGTINDQEKAFLLSQGASAGTLNDMWNEYLIGQGYTDNYLHDKLRSWARTPIIA